MLREKRYRELIPMTHEQYLDEPWDVIEWTLRIDNMQREFRHGRDESPRA